MQYFKHFTKMRSDTKIRRLFAKYGLEGYGLYNLILESIAESIETESPLPFLEENCDDIALFYNGNSAKIDEMVRYMIQEGLLTVETTQNRIACYKIYKYLEQSQTRSEKIRDLIASYKDSREIIDGQKCLGLSQTKVIEENRIDKEENKKKNEKKQTVYSQDFENFWDSYPKREGKKTAFGAFNSLLKTGKTIQVIHERLAVYKNRIREQNTGYQYIRLPATFLNNIDDYAQTLGAPVQKQEYRPKLCPKCGSPMTGLSCKHCFTNFDSDGNEV